MSFKDTIQHDLNVFLNIDEFAEIHDINGASMPAVVDGDLMKGLPRQPIDLYNAASGVYVGQITVYVRFSDLGYRPVVDQHLRLDEQLYLVSTSSESKGLVTLVLEANQA